MNKLPTDREILKCIFDLYKSDYPGPKGENGRGANDPFVLIDLTKVAARLDCGTDFIFGACTITSMQSIATNRTMVRALIYSS